MELLYKLAFGGVNFRQSWNCDWRECCGKFGGERTDVDNNQSSGGVMTFLHYLNGPILYRPNFESQVIVIVIS